MFNEYIQTSSINYQVKLAGRRKPGPPVKRLLYDAKPIHLDTLVGIMLFTCTVNSDPLKSLIKKKFKYTCPFSNCI